MREWIYDSWNSVMNLEHNPLRNIPNLQVQHMVMQVLAWMWCLTFAQLAGSWWIFGFSAIAHVVLIGAIVITVATFETAKRKPGFFLKAGYHSYPRARQNMYMDGKKIKLDDNDPGGEHE